jgi:putative heme iron utilization protein
MAPPDRAAPEFIKSFITAQRWGVLSTLSISQQGFPFGSVVPYDIDSQGRIIIYISLIAEHYKNLKSDNRASLTIIDSFGVSDPQAHARATLLLRFEPVGAPEAQSVQARYERRFPQSINYEIAHNFLFMRGEVDRIRWIGGFGDIQWMSSEAYQSAEADRLAYSSWEAIEHMNQDHRDALVDLVKAHSALSPRESEVGMSMLSATEMQIRVRQGTESKEITIPLTREVHEEGEVRAVVVETLKAARQKLSR